MLAAADFMSFCSMSIMAPFYPQEATNKGMTESMAGFVFGYYALVVFLSSPVFGKIVNPPEILEKHFLIWISVSATESWGENPVCRRFTDIRLVQHHIRVKARIKR